MEIETLIFEDLPVIYKKIIKQIHYGVPIENVKQAMKLYGFDDSEIATFFTLKSNLSNLEGLSITIFYVFFLVTIMDIEILIRMVVGIEEIKVKHQEEKEIRKVDKLI